MHLARFLILRLGTLQMSRCDPKLFLENTGKIAITLITQTIADLLQGIGRPADHILCKKHFSVIYVFCHGHIRFLLENMRDIFLGKTSVCTDRMECDRLGDMLVDIADDIDNVRIAAAKI